jgi:ceramide glucosyltransferase
LLILSSFTPSAWIILLASLALRWAVAFTITGFTRDETSRKWIIWLPVRDLLTGLIWIAGLLGNKVEWRGQQYLLHDDGSMIPVTETKRHGESHVDL